MFLQFYFTKLKLPDHIYGVCIYIYNIYMYIYMIFPSESMSSKLVQFWMTFFFTVTISTSLNFFFRFVFPLNAILMDRFSIQKRKEKMKFHRPPTPCPHPMRQLNAFSLSTEQRVWDWINRLFFVFLDLKITLY